MKSPNRGASGESDGAFDAFHLPAPGADLQVELRQGEGAGPDLRLPALTADQLRHQIAALRDAQRRHLRDRPVRDVVAAIDGVARRLLDPRDALRARAVDLVAAATGLSAPMTAHVLDRMAEDWRSEALLPLLEDEFGGADALDHFAAAGEPGLRRRAIGPEVTFHVFSGNVPGVSVTSLIRALLVKSASLAKTAAGEPILAPLFARALAEVDPGLGACLAVTYWKGGSEELEEIALNEADAVIAYGGHPAIQSLRERTPPRTPFLGYGHHVSFAVIGREALQSDRASRVAAAAALAVATFDQHGCVSPHLIYVEEDGERTPAEWARLLGDELARLEHTLPRGTLSTGEIVAIQNARAEAEFGQLAGSGHALHASSGGTEWTVILEPDAEFRASCLNRLVRVCPVASLDRIPELVARFGPALQTVGFEGSPARFTGVAEQLARLGATRLTTLERMPWPPPGWRHDGRPPLADLVRWCDWETG